MYVCNDIKNKSSKVAVRGQRDITTPGGKNDQLSGQMVLEGLILRVTCFPSSTEISLSYNGTLILKRKLGSGELSPFLWPVFTIILKDVCLSNNAIGFYGGNQRSVNICMTEEEIEIC